MIRSILAQDRIKYLLLAEEFYSSDAVSHSIPLSHFEDTFDAALSGHPCCHLVMVICDDIAVGFGLLAITYSCEAGGETVWLEELFIKQDYRSRGLGKEFFNYTHARYPNAKRFRLEVARDNSRAIDLYSKLGYVELDYMQMIRDIK